MIINLNIHSKYPSKSINSFIHFNRQFSLVIFAQPLYIDIYIFITPYILYFFFSSIYFFSIICYNNYA